MARKKDAADVIKGRPAPTRGPRTSAAQRGGARWTKSTRGLGGASTTWTAQIGPSRSGGRGERRPGAQHGTRPAWLSHGAAAAHERKWRRGAARGRRQGGGGNRLHQPATWNGGGWPEDSGAHGDGDAPQEAASSPATEEGGAPADFRRRGAAAEVLLVLAELREATARVDVDRSGGATRLEAAGSRPDVAESAGEVGRRRGVVEGLTGADFRGESGGNGGGRGGDRAHVVGCELGCGRAPDFAATWTAMAVGVGRREVGGGADGWDRRSHLSAKGEKEGCKTDFCERAK
uniref:DUF834 domain-containing protein n=1 Tax=Oryza sativa subsp. japonica TaxID=39947 RepID=Q6Z7U8_ORYSJ|nr:hypothetical protein [Oryza sativa Japonica Group]